MNWRTAIKGVVVTAVVIAALVWGVKWWNGGKAPLEAEATMTETTKVTRGHLRQTVVSPGLVVSNLDIEIKCRASGEVIKLPFDISAPVKKGDLLLELDPVDQERLVQQSQAALSASEARLAQAKSTLASAQQSLIADRQKASAAVQAAEVRATDATSKAQREEQLLEKKYSSEEGVETAQTTAAQAQQELKTSKAQIESLKALELDLETKRQQIKLAEAQVESDTIALSLAKRQLGYTQVFSPIDGVVSDRKVQIGQIISSGISNVGGGTTVLTLSDLSHIYILASVDETNIGLVKVGQEAEITVESFPNVLFKGKVDRIATKGLSVSNVVTFEVRVEVVGDNKTMLKLAMTTNVRILIADKSDILMVPGNAIVRKKGEAFVTLAKPDGTPGELKPVVLGIFDDNNTEIVSGVEENTTVVVQNSEADSKWNAGSPAQDDARRRMMMMRTIGGGGRR
ncbi:MAG: efflux RND transporter periplasmic adaptor subunit [Candidatus Hydrogenedentales bacterium]|jgi:multidrug resistance efflux pump